MALEKAPRRKEKLLKLCVFAPEVSGLRDKY